MNVEVLSAGGGMAARGPNEWIDAIHSLLDEEALAQRMGQQGREVVLRNYSLSALAPLLAGILRLCS
jgi:glycosyltransferase involved in cell wall biosynthesis